MSVVEKPATELGYPHQMWAKTIANKKLGTEYASRQKDTETSLENQDLSVPHCWRLNTWGKRKQVHLKDGSGVGDSSEEVGVQSWCPREWGCPAHFILLGFLSSHVPTSSSLAYMAKVGKGGIQKDFSLFFPSTSLVGGHGHWKMQKCRQKAREKFFFCFWLGETVD